MKSELILTRRTLVATAMIAPVMALPGCAGMGGLNLVEAIQRLLGLSSQRALTGLVQENGFFASDAARITLPDRLGGGMAGGLLASLLSTRAVQDRLLHQVNRAAAKGAELAAPVVAQTISTLSPTDALAIVRGGPTAATGLLEQTLGGRLIDVMLPGIGSGLRMFDSGIVTQVLNAATGINFDGLRADVATKASSGIFRAIGREEAAIRANPSATGDPLISAVFGATNAIGRF